MLCTEATAVNHGHNAIKGVTLYCRSWTCEICQPRRKRELVRLATLGGANAFITLTVNPSQPGTRHDRAKALSHAWAIVVKRAKKRYGYAKIKYLCVFEATQRGEAHLHILAKTGWIDQKWLSAQMRELIGAPIVDIRKIKNTVQAAHYVAKYIGKEPQRFKGCKRYWTTKAWKPVTEKQEPEPGYWMDTWEYRKTNIRDYTWIWAAIFDQVEWRAGVLYAGSPIP